MITRRTFAPHGNLAQDLLFFFGGPPLFCDPSRSKPLTEAFLLFLLVGPLPRCVWNWTPRACRDVYTALSFPLSLPSCARPVCALVLLGPTLLPYVASDSNFCYYNPPFSAVPSSPHEGHPFVAGVVLRTVPPRVGSSEGPFPESVFPNCFPGMWIRVPA